MSHAHAHTLIRNAVATAVTGLASTGARVFPNRLHPLTQAELPALRVFADSETVNPLTIHKPVVQERTLSVAVECCASADTDMDEACDQMQLEVEKVLAAGITVDGLMLDPILTASRYDYEAGSPPVGVKRLDFQIMFQTLANAPDSLT